jgi:hypothetical protein
MRELPESGPQPAIAFCRPLLGNALILGPYPTLNNLHAENKIQSVLFNLIYWPVSLQWIRPLCRPLLW